MLRRAADIPMQESLGSFFPDSFTNSLGLPVGDPYFHCSLL